MLVCINPESKHALIFRTEDVKSIDCDCAHSEKQSVVKFTDGSSVTLLFSVTEAQNRLRDAAQNGSKSPYWVTTNENVNKLLQPYQSAYWPSSPFSFNHQFTPKTSTSGPVE